MHELSDVIFNDEIVIWKPTPHMHPNWVVNGVNVDICIGEATKSKPSKTNCSDWRSASTVHSNGTVATEKEIEMDVHPVEFCSTNFDTAWLFEHHIAITYKSMTFTRSYWIQFSHDAYMLTELYLGSVWFTTKIEWMVEIINGNVFPSQLASFFLRLYEATSDNRKKATMCLSRAKNCNWRCITLMSSV